MATEDKFEKITIDLRPYGWGIRDVDVIWPKDHEGGTPGPNSVGSDQIVDDSIMEEDLNDSVKDRMTITHDASTGGLRLGGYAKPGNVPSNSENSGGSGGFPDEMEVEEGD